MRNEDGHTLITDFKKMGPAPFTLGPLLLLLVCLPSITVCESNLRHTQSVLQAYPFESKPIDCTGYKVVDSCTQWTADIEKERKDPKNGKSWTLEEKCNQACTFRKKQKLFLTCEKSSSVLRSKARCESGRRISYKCKRETCKENPAPASAPAGATAGATATADSQEKKELIKLFRDFKFFDKVNSFQKSYEEVMTPAFLKEITEEIKEDQRSDEGFRELTKDLEVEYPEWLKTEHLCYNRHPSTVCQEFKMKSWKRELCECILTSKMSRKSRRLEVVNELVKVFGTPATEPIRKLEEETEMETDQERIQQMEDAAFSDTITQLHKLVKIATRMSLFANSADDLLRVIPNFHDRMLNTHADSLSFWKRTNERYNPFKDTYLDQTLKAAYDTFGLGTQKKGFCDKDKDGHDLREGLVAKLSATSEVLETCYTLKVRACVGGNCWSSVFVPACEVVCAHACACRALWVTNRPLRHGQLTRLT